MSKKLFALFFMFFLAVIVFLIVLNTYAKNPALQSLSHSLSPTPAFGTSLFLSPSVLGVTDGESASISVVVDFQGNQRTSRPTFIQIELSYNPAVLTNMKIQPGNFLTNPAILLQKIDSKTGRISYALESAYDTNVKKTGGTAAILTFTPKIGGIYHETSIDFLPKTVTRVKDEANTLKSSYGAKIIILPSFNPLATGSAGQSPLPSSQFPTGQQIHR